MPTRADFYTKTSRGWIYHGSVSHDGYPHGIEKSVLEAKSRRNFEREVRIMLKGRDDSSFAKRDGWPWPWEDSATSDYAYVFFTKENRTFISEYGGPLFSYRDFKAFNSYLKRLEARNAKYENNPELQTEPKELDAWLVDRGLNTITEFPNMTHIQKVTLGRRSGLLTIPF